MVKSGNIQGIFTEEATYSRKTIQRFGKVHMHFSPPVYLDPGSGSFILQLVIAALLGLGVALRASWGKLKQRFGTKTDADESEEADDDGGIN